MVLQVNHLLAALPSILKSEVRVGHLPLRAVALGEVQYLLQLLLQDLLVFL